VEEVAVLLERALFGFASYGRVRFHHRSVIEYLTASCLQEMLNNGMSLKAVKRLLFAETAQGIYVVKPSMRPVAAWLGLSERSIFEEIRNREPNVLLDFGDPQSLTLLQKQECLVEFVGRYGTGEWRGLNAPYIQLHRFACPELGDLLIRLWNSGIENHEVRLLILDLFALVPVLRASDIAFNLATDNKKGYIERSSAVEILAKLNDGRLEGITNSMELSTDEWPDDLINRTIPTLFPKNISAARLCSILGRTSLSKNIGCGIDYYLSKTIEETEVSEDYLTEMMNGLVENIADSTEWRKDKWPHISSRKKHLPEILVSICLRLLEGESLSVGIIRSSVIALRVSGSVHNDDKPLGKLRKILSEGDVASRQIAFWSDYEFMQQHHSEGGPRSRFWEINHDGSIIIDEQKDEKWLLEDCSSLTTNLGKREVALEAALTYVVGGKDDLHNSIGKLKALVSDEPSLVARVDEFLKPAPVNASYKRMEKSYRKRTEQELRRKAKDRASWVLLCREIISNPGAAFSKERQYNTVWNIWRVLSQLEAREDALAWNRRFLENCFGKDIVDKIRSCMMKAWRTNNPTLRSERSTEEKNTYYLSWKMGLAAISAEAEDRDWVKKLTSDEVILALHYAPLEMSGFPFWLKDLIKQDSTKVEEILGHELESELDETADSHFHSGLLQDICNANSDIYRVFMPRLKEWFSKSHSRIRISENEDRVIDRLNRVVGLLLKNTDTAFESEIKSITSSNIDESNSLAFSRFWLGILMILDPQDATSKLENILKTIPPSKESEGVRLFAYLFDRFHSYGVAIDLSDNRFPPRLLLRLLQLAYKHVMPKEDNHHKGSYRPKMRDYAESARNSLLNALHDSNGVEGWNAKLELSKMPELKSFRDRTIFLATEKAAEEVDNPSINQIELVNLFRLQEIRPNTHNEIFSIMLDRIGDIEDSLHRDDSPREEWAKIDEEKIMRRALSREFRRMSNQTYNVDQEAVTADEKETDIRLRSCSADVEAVIELKLGDNRSGRDLRDTIRNQLVKKYMASDACRSGCLLVTVSKDRKWEHPDTKEYLGLGMLEKMLQQEAKTVAYEMGNMIQVSANVLDLRPRLTTESAKSLASI